MVRVHKHKVRPKPLCFLEPSLIIVAWMLDGSCLPYVCSYWPNLNLVEVL
jgi:hypothetical protein